MEHSIKNLEKSQKEITAKIPLAEMDKYIDRALTQLQTEMELPGFRKGKAPKNLIQQNLGEAKIFHEASHLAIEDSYFQILQAHPEIAPIGQPQADIIKMAAGNDLEYKITITVMPEVKLGDYKNIKGKLEVKPTEDQQIQQELLSLQKRRATYITKEEPAAMGDRVEIDFEVRVDKVKIEGGESKNHPVVIGESKFIPGFEEQLVGLKKDDTKEFELQFPENYKQGLSGKMAQFKVTVKIVQKVSLPELNDDFAKALGESEGIETLKNNIKQNLEHESQRQAENHLQHQLLEQVTTKMQVEIPAVLIESQLNDMMAEFKSNIMQAGMELEQYLQSVNATLDQLNQEWRPVAEQKVKESLAIREIALQEKITATEEEIVEKVNQTLKYYPNEEEIRSKIDMPRFKEYIAGDILRNKVLDYLKNIANKN